MGKKTVGNPKLESFSVVIPAYKEAENLKWLLPALVQEMAVRFDDFEIVVVDTMTAQDNTRAVCAQTTHTLYINRQNGNTYGDAVRSGIAAASKQKIIFMDADGSHSPQYIPLMASLSSQYDLVVGSRYVAGGSTDNSKILIFQSKMLNFVYRFLFNIKIKDISNSLRLYDAAQLKSLKLACNCFDIVEEILIKLQLAYPSLTFKEIPIRFEKRKEGQSQREFFVFICSFVKTALKLLCYRFKFMFTKAAVKK